MTIRHRLSIFHLWKRPSFLLLETFSFLQAVPFPGGPQFSIRRDGCSAQREFPARFRRFLVTFRWVSEFFWMMGKLVALSNEALRTVLKSGSFRLAWTAKNFM